MVVVKFVLRGVAGGCLLGGGRIVVKFLINVSVPLVVVLIQLYFIIYVR